MRIATKLLLDKLLVRGLTFDTCWTIAAVIEQSINVSKYLYFETVMPSSFTNALFYPLAGSSFSKLLKELNHTSKNLINIQKIEKKFKFKGIFSQEKLILKI